MFVDALSNTGLIVNKNLAEGVKINIMDVEKAQIAELELWQDKPTIEADNVFRKMLLTLLQLKMVNQFLQNQQTDYTTLQEHMLEKTIQFVSKNTKEIPSN